MWVDLCDLYGGPAESKKNMAIASASLKVLKYKSEDTFPFSTYATQVMGHFESLSQGGEPTPDS